MNRMQRNITRGLCLFTFLIIKVVPSFAQKPEIKSSDKIEGHMEERVTIKGASSEQMHLK